VLHRAWALFRKQLEAIARARRRGGGWTEVQGFLISRPVPAEGIADLITGYRAARKTALER
jgi:hypothetical protein